ncbi:unnamed protein product, partial [Prorocentrum cordatum]
ARDILRRHHSAQKMNRHWTCSRCKKSAPNHKWFCSCGSKWGDKAPKPRSKGRFKDTPPNTQQTSRAQQLEFGRITGKILQATPEAAYSHPKYLQPPDSPDLQPMFRAEMKNNITSLAALIKASRYAGKENPYAAEEIAVYKFMVSQMEPLDKQIADVRIRMEKEAARAAEVQKKITQLRDEADSLMYDAEPLKQTLEQFTHEKAAEKDSGMGDATAVPIGARRPVATPPCSASSSSAPMQPVLSAVQNIQQRQRTQDDMIKQMLDHMAYNSSMLAALQKLYQQTPQGKGKRSDAGNPYPMETPPLTAALVAMLAPTQEMKHPEVERVPGPTGTHPGAPSLQTVEAMAAAYVALAKQHPELIPSSPT